MRSRQVVAGRLFAVAIVVMLGLVAISGIVTTDKLPLYREESQGADETPEVTNLAEESTKFYHDRGQDSFGNGVNIGFAPGQIRSVAEGDLDNDGDLDLVSAGGSNVPPCTTGAIQIWDNPGAPFALPWGVNTIGCHNTSVFNDVEVGDLDNDGDLDIITAVNDTAFNLIIWENPLDFGIGNPWVGLWGTGLGVLVGSADGRVNDTAIGDLNNDGFLDIITVDDGIILGPEGNIFIWRNNANPFAGPWTGTDIDGPSVAGFPKISVTV